MSAGGVPGVEVRWGEDADEAALRLGLAAGPWTPWEGGAGAEARIDPDATLHPFDAPAMPRLLRLGHALAGVQLTLRDPGRDLDDVDRAVRAEFGDEGPGDPFQPARGGGMVHLRGDTLTLVGPALADAYRSYQLRLGLAGLSAGLRP